MKKLIEYFATKHLFTNFLFIGVFIGGIFFWYGTPKEELPDISLDFVRISVTYPGASAEEVEYFVTWPIEDELRSVNGIERITSTSSEGRASIIAELEKDRGDRGNTVADIKNTVLSVNLPVEILDLPVIKEFKSSLKAIIDIGIYFKDKEFFNDRDRKKIQTYAHALEKKLLSYPEINSLRISGYLREELQVQLNPKKLEFYRIPISTVISEIKKANIRVPAGSLESVAEERVTVDGELDRKSELLPLPIQGNFEGRSIRLSDISEIKDTYEENTNLMKVNGHEAIMVNVIKSGSVGILDAVDLVKKTVSEFKSTFNKEGIELVILDDESSDVRNRIKLISSNGLIGFILILITLFLFMNFKTGFWVAMGIPFTFSLTLIIAGFAGFTINNMTLAAVLIVMGMVVDDAIVVSENIIRLRQQGMDSFRAAIEGTSYVLLPITASILTTCAAFLPLLALEGRISFMSDPIPPIVSLMLLSSLIESVLILPAHMNLNIPRWLRILFSLGTLPLIERMAQKRKQSNNDPGIAPKNHWFDKVENTYGKFLFRVLRYRIIVVIIFIVFVFLGGYLIQTKLSFALFPREEATSISLMAEAPEGYRKYETAKLAGKLEAIFIPYIGKELVGFRTSIGKSRHGMIAKENFMRMRIELVRADEREKSLNHLVKEWEEKLKSIKGFTKVRFARHRFGMSSGTPIEVVVQEGDNAKRKIISKKLKDKLESLKYLKNVEIGEPYRSPEFKIRLKRDLIKRLGINTADIGQALRTAVEGTIAYKIIDGDEEKYVRISISEKDRTSINRVLSVPVKNNLGYLVPLNEVVTMKKTKSPVEIQRLNNQRIVYVYSDINSESKMTPLKIAQYLEKNIFPELVSESPTTNFSFEGEIKMTRETSGNFGFALVIAFFLIFTILALQFNSLSRPFTIMFTIPPAMAAVVYTFLIHGMSTFGFFGFIGAVGLAGVIVNDAIVLLRKLDDEYGEYNERRISDRKIAEISSTRLKAVLLTTITTAAGLFPTAYGLMGYDSMLSEMMLAIAWGLIFGTAITLGLVPAVYSIEKSIRNILSRNSSKLADKIS